MKRQLGVAFLFVVVFASTAFAIADKIPYSAFVRDAGDNPMQGQHNFIFSIFNVSSGGEPMWNESERIELVNGILSHVLGSVNSFPTDLFLAGDEFYLQVSIDGIPSTNRAYLGMYPHARVAQYLSANGTILGNVTINGTAVFSSIVVGNLTVLGMVNLPNNSITTEMISNLSASKLFNLSALDFKILVSAFNVTPGNFTGSFNFTGNVTINDTLIARVLNATSIYQNGYLVLDRNTNFGGDVSGIWNNIQVNDNSHYHDDSTLNSLNANKLFNLTTLYNNIQVSADNVSAGTFWGNNYVFNGSLIVLGNLSVVNITSVNASTLNVNGSFIPSINNIFDIGSPSTYWANGYFNNLYTNNFYIAGNSVLTNVTNFGGDVSGTYDNLKVYWANGSFNVLVSQANISGGLIIPWSNITGYPGVTLDIDTNTTGTLSWARVAFSGVTVPWSNVTGFPGVSIPQANITTGITLLWANITGFPGVTVPWANVTGFPGVSIPQANITDGITIPASNVTGLSQGHNTTGFYLYNDTNTTYFNETQLNATIGARDIKYNESGISRNGTFSLSSNNGTIYVLLSGRDIIHIKGVIIGTTNSVPIIFTLDGDTGTNYAYRRIQSYRFLQQAITVNPQPNVTMEGYDFNGNRTIEIKIYKNANGVTGDFFVSSASDNLVGSISGSIVATNTTVGTFTWRNLTSPVDSLQIKVGSGSILAGSYMIEVSEAK